MTRGEKNLLGANKEKNSKWSTKNKEEHYETEKKTLSIWISFDVVEKKIYF